MLDTRNRSHIGICKSSLAYSLIMQNLVVISHKQHTGMIHEPRMITSSNKSKLNK